MRRKEPLDFTPTCGAAQSVWLPDEWAEVTKYFQYLGQVANGLTIGAKLPGWIAVASHRTRDVHTQQLAFPAQVACMLAVLVEPGTQYQTDLGSAQPLRRECRACLPSVEQNFLSRCDGVHLCRQGLQRERAAAPLSRWAGCRPSKRLLIGRKKPAHRLLLPESTEPDSLDLPIQAT